jgi:hypothetical protein
MAWRYKSLNPYLRLMEKWSAGRAFRGLFPEKRPSSYNRWVTSTDTCPVTLMGFCLPKALPKSTPQPTFVSRSPLVVPISLQCQSSDPHHPDTPPLQGLKYRSGDVYLDRSRSSALPRFPHLVNSGHNLDRRSALAYRFTPTSAASVARNLTSVRASPAT